MAQFLDLNGLQSLWTKLDNRDTEIVAELKRLSNFPIITKTKQEWEQSLSLISEKGTLYIYSDYKEDNGKKIAGLKVGDGSTLLSALPFLDTLYDTHIKDNSIHTSTEEREKWNNKVTIDESQVEQELLIFNK